MDPERYLVDVFDRLAAAGARDTCVRIAAQAANELANAEGVCILSATGDGCVVALAQREQVHVCDLRNSGLYRAASPLLRGDAPGSRTLWGKEDFIALPTGEQLRIGVALIVPLRPASGHAAIVFLWQPGRMTDSRGTLRLELLAKALGLANQHRTLADLQHRLRNNLAQMRSIVRRSHETAESAEHFALHLEARVCALARMQGMVASAGAEGVELEELIRTELIASAVPERSYSMQGPSVRLHTKGAESLALTVHELVTNSLKFGSLAMPNGHLAASWAVSGGQSPYLRIRWIESGATIASVAPRRRGFGQELIECTLPYELRAKTCLTFSPGGVLCEIEIPLEACAADVEPHAHKAAQGGTR